MQRRLDRAERIAGAWRLDRAARLSEPERTSEGYLVAECAVAQPGVLFYRQADGSWFRELVTEETLRQSADTLRNKPVTLEHPAEFVNPDNLREHLQGTVPETRIDDDGKLIARIVVQNREALDALERGVRELSPGYTVRVDHRGGTSEHGQYDGVQMKRFYNHLAITERARGGRELVIRVDGAVEVDPFNTAGEPGTTTEVPMRPIIAALMAMDVTKEDAEKGADNVLAIAQESIKLDSAAELETANAATETEKARADKAENELKEATAFEARLDWHKARTDLEAKAAQYKVEDVEKLDNADLARAILAAAEVDCDGKSDEWVSARIDALAERIDSRREPGSAFKVVSIPGKRSDSGEAPKRSVGTHRSIDRYHNTAAK